MTDLTWPQYIVPSGAQWSFRSATGSFNERSTVRAGDRYACTLAMPVLPRARGTELRAFLARLRGSTNRAVMPVWGHTRRGTASQNGKVAGGSQTGTSLAVDGLEAGLTNAVRIGDFIAVGGRLYMVAADTDTTGGGAMTVTLTHPISTAPADNADVTLVNPQGRFIFTGTVGWQNIPLGHIAISPLEFLEDIP